MFVKKKVKNNLFRFVNCKTKFHSQILKLEINLSKKHWRLILPKKDYNSYHWFSTCCSGQNRRT